MLINLLNVDYLNDLSYIGFLLNSDRKKLIVEYCDMQIRTLEMLNPLFKSMRPHLLTILRDINKEIISLSETIKEEETLISQ